MTGISPNVACHHLDVDPTVKLVRQRPRRMTPDKRLKVSEEQISWKIYTDGSWNQSASGIGCVLICPDGLQIEKCVRPRFKAANNGAEYEATIFGMKTTIDLGATDIAIFIDSKLINLEKSRNDMRHVDALAYLSAAIDCKEPRMIQGEYQELSNIEFTTLNHIKVYVAECLALQVLYYAQASYAVWARKRMREEVEINRGDIDSEMPSPFCFQTKI
ncbi:hypothetical protein IFM89_030398 [Coptis chinensis]|uniref:RNase H type-1 domain-containing protein n=1 Tax=Coptis chinensis TaxID=261450 RepID=A0A835HY67_9MAGN|nr:hypothetical protein IFM89_030398 [Coptis chinensis]